MTTEPRTLIINWLRTKGFHANDIAVAIRWYDKKCKDGNVPSDYQVYHIAENCHLAAVATSKDQIPKIGLNVTYKVHAKVVAISIASGFLGGAILQWLLAQMP